MAITDPQTYPEKTGIDPRDQDHPHFPKKLVKIYMKPVAQKIVEKGLWLETIIVIMIVFSGITIVLGREPSVLWYMILLILLVVLGIKALIKLDTVLPPPEIGEDEPEVKEVTQ